jgi:hypothetical protein
LDCACDLEPKLEAAKSASTLPVDPWELEDEDELESAAEPASASPPVGPRKLEEEEEEGVEGVGVFLLKESNGV